MALVIVLGIIVLVTTLVVGFVMRAGSERITSSNYRTVASTRQLADTAVNLVQAQINHATTQGSTHAWASQPGVIRRFGNGGALELAYRLYSAASMTTTKATDLAGDVPPATWSSSPAIWCDLNYPVTTTNSSGAAVFSFPILDPRDPTNPNLISTIEGFSLTAPPGAQSNIALPKYQPAPMPVRWLYVLQNGEIVTPSGSGKVVTVTGASQTNPIVGRIAFWTDDETCKVNINTASHGTFWDTPRFNYADERDQAGSGLALYQPTAGEYQRYPGHPAMTTLKKVFPTLSSANLFKLTPRYDKGGSDEATVPVPVSPAAGVNPNANYIQKKTERLYTSVGELAFDSTRNTSSLTRQQLESARFFLTTHSRAPEVNLYGKPRVAIWPIHDINDASHRSLVDKLIAFCSTAGGNRYYFTRSDNTSSTTDINIGRNRQLLDYLDTLTTTNVPGFTSNFSTKYGADQRQILTDIFDYIRTINLRDATVTAPYAIKTFASTNSGAFAGRGQVSPSIRSDWGTQGQGRFPRITEATMLFIGMGKGAVPAVPPSTTSTSGIAVESIQLPTYTSSAPSGGQMPPDNTTAVQGFFLLSFFTPSMGYTAMDPGFTIKVSGLDKFTLNSIPMEMTSSATIFVSAAKGAYSSYASVGPGGGIIDFRIMMSNRTLQNVNPDPVTNFPFYSKILEFPTGGTMELELQGIPSLTIELYNGNAAAAGNLIQTYHIPFPKQKMQVPLVATDPVLRRFGTSALIPLKGSWADSIPVDRGSCSFNNTWNSNSINATNDTLISQVLNGAFADPRLLAVSDIPSIAFAPHPKNSDLATGVTRAAYSLRIGSGTPMTFATPYGKLVANSADSITNFATSSPAKPQLVSPTVTNGVMIPGGPVGDWDNGVGHQPDGPYVNKADEGNFYRPAGGIPYFDSGQFETRMANLTFFSANRQVPSAGILGSIPTGVKRTKPWQTLLFRPGPSGHPGAVNPPDHLMLDLFWMPVAEPYAISEPFSTAGKVNLNYQILPFTYITRSTALRSVLASEKVAAVPLSAAAGYKTVVQNTNARLPLNLDEANGTLRQFKAKFDGYDIFKSASEICDIYLVPSNKNWTSDSAARTDWYGADFAMVGDNTRERPYANIYPRVTTKSNVYTVYFTAQSIKNSNSDPTQWNEDRGTISGEYRGATTLERYIDPNNAAVPIPDYALPATTTTLETLYKWRVVSDTQFAP